MAEQEQISPLESLPPSPKENQPALEPRLESKEPVLSSAAAFDASLENAPKRGRGRPRKDGTAPTAVPENIVSQKEKKALQTEERKKKCVEAGEISAKMILGGLSAFGPAYTLSLEQPHEKAVVENAITNTGQFFEHMDWCDLPPVMGFIVAWAGVGIAIANKPENKPKVMALKDKLIARFLNWRANKAAKG